MDHGMREIFRILEQTREIFRREQTREMLEARRSILPTHMTNTLWYRTDWTDIPLG